LGQINNDFNNLLVSVNVPILMVGTDLTVRRFTPMAEKVFNLIPGDVGRRLSDLSRILEVLDIEQILTRVIDELSTIEREVHDREGRWWLLRVRPYRTRDNRIEGAVILLSDIDALHRALEIAVGLVGQPLILLSADLKVRNANKPFLDAFGLSQPDVDGKPIFDLSDRQFDIPNLRLLLEDILPKNQRVTDYEVEANFKNSGRRKLKINASRFEEGRGMQITLMAMEDLTAKPTT
jgi:two-component system CheB/CheR fusion protein